MGWPKKTKETRLLSEDPDLLLSFYFERSKSELFFDDNRRTSTKENIHEQSRTVPKNAQAVPKR